MLSLSLFGNFNLERATERHQCAVWSLQWLHRSIERTPELWLQESQMIQDEPPWSSFSWLLLHHELQLSEPSLCFTGTKIKHNSVLTQTLLALTCLFCYPSQTQGWDLWVPVANSPLRFLSSMLRSRKTLPCAEHRILGHLAEGM